MTIQLDNLPPVNDYERAAFFQALSRRMKPVFGQGRTVTSADIREVFFAVNPDYDGFGMAVSVFNTMILPALKIEVEEAGYKVVP